MQPVPSEQRCTPGQLDRFRELIAARTGIVYTEKKDFVLEARLQRLIRESGISSPDELLRRLSSDDRSLWSHFVRAVTTNHTYFFREAEHFEHMAADIRRRKQSKPLIWVAAASTGEEVYSIAIHLLMAGIGDYFIMASDLNTENLKVMKAGEYPAARLRNIPDDVRRRYFRRIGEENGEAVFQVVPLLKTGIAARSLNLFDRLRFEERFDYIFCRNVLMYFGAGRQETAVRTIAENLKAEGILYTGCSEMLLGYGAYFKTVDVGVYVKRETP